jgi:hypothetical protein
MGPRSIDVDPCDVADSQDDSMPEEQAEPQKPGDRRDPWLMRRETAELLGISVATLRRRIEKEGLLRIEKRGGIVYFWKDSVLALRPELAAHREKPNLRKRWADGAEAAQVFLLLNRGKNLREIVIELQLPPDRIREHYHQWALSLEEGERLRYGGDPPTPPLEPSPPTHAGGELQSVPPVTGPAPDAASTIPDVPPGEDLGALVVAAAGRLLGQLGPPDPGPVDADAPSTS